MADNIADMETTHLQLSSKKRSADGSIQPIARIKRVQLPATIGMRMNTPRRNSRIIAAAQQVQKRKSVIWDSSDISHQDYGSLMPAPYFDDDWKAKRDEKLLEVRLRLGFIGSKLYTGERRVKLSYKDVTSGESLAMACVSIYRKEFAALGMEVEGHIWGWKLQHLWCPSKYTLDNEIDTTHDNFVADPIGLRTWFEKTNNRLVGPGEQTTWIPGITAMIGGFNEEDMIIGSAYRTRFEYKFINQDLEKIIEKTSNPRLIVDDGVLRHVEINTDGNREVKDLKKNGLAKYESRQTGLDIRLAEELRASVRLQEEAAFEWVEPNTVGLGW